MEQIIPRATHRERGAAAFDKGIGHDAHGMNPGSAAIDDWQLGWRQRRDQRLQEKYDRLTRLQADTLRSSALPAAEPAGDDLTRSLFAMVR